MELLGPALGLLELESIARGVVVVDQLVKKARVHVFVAEAVTPGKYLVLFSGEVAEVEESMRAGELTGGPMVIDRLLLPQLAHGVRLALSGRPEARQARDAVGIVETHTVASAVLAADTAVKRAKVRLTQLHLAKGIGGKGWFTLAGEQHDVEAALDGAGASIQPQLLVTTEIIQRPHADVPKSVF
jgi:microcompartment protein CcmL/EutN